MRRHLPAQAGERAGDDGGGERGAAPGGVAVEVAELEEAARQPDTRGPDVHPWAVRGELGPVVAVECADRDHAGQCRGPEGTRRRGVARARDDGGEARERLGQPEGRRVVEGVPAEGEVHHVGPAVAQHGERPQQRRLVADAVAVEEAEDAQPYAGRVPQDQPGHERAVSRLPVAHAVAVRVGRLGDVVVVPPCHPGVRRQAGVEDRGDDLARLTRLVRRGRRGCGRPAGPAEEQRLAGKDMVGGGGVPAVAERGRQVDHVGARRQPYAVDPAGARKGLGGQCPPGDGGGRGGQEFVGPDQGGPSGEGFDELTAHGKAFPY